MAHTISSPKANSVWLNTGSGNKICSLSSFLYLVFLPPFLLLPFIPLEFLFFSSSSNSSLSPPPLLLLPYSTLPRPHIPLSSFLLSSELVLSIRKTRDPRTCWHNTSLCAVQCTVYTVIPTLCAFNDVAGIQHD